MNYRLSKATGAATGCYSWRGPGAAVAVLLALAITFPALASEWEGTWLVRAEQELSHCPDLGRTYGKIFTYTITVRNGQITAYEKDRGRVFTGVIDPKNPSKAHLRGVVAMEGGYTNEIIDVELVDANHMKGGTVWHWSDGVYQCGGSLIFAGVRSGTAKGSGTAKKPPVNPPAQSPPVPEPKSLPTPETGSGS